jgi:hypothetical protein
VQIQYIICNSSSPALPNKIAQIPVARPSELTLC